MLKKAGKKSLLRLYFILCDHTGNHQFQNKKIYTSCHYANDH